MFGRMTNTFDPRLSILASLTPPSDGDISKVKKYRNYYDGIQPNPLNESQLELLSEDIEYKLNLCPQAVEIPANRLKVRGLEAMVKDNEPLTEQLNEALQKVWDSNEFDEQQAELYIAAGRDRAAYLMVHFDEADNRVKLTVNFEHDGEEGVYAVYGDDAHTPLYFVKEWSEVLDRFNPRQKRTAKRRTLYFNNRVEKYISDPKRDGGKWVPLDPNSASWQTVTIDDQSYETTVIWWTDDGTATGKPLGLPVFHFRAGSGKHGTSDLARVVPDVQDGINLKNAMVSAAEQLQGTPLWVVFTKDTMPRELEWFPGAYVQFSDGSVGAFPSADINALNNSLDSGIRRFASLTDTPPYLYHLTGQVMAEGSQQQSETQLLAKVKRRQITFGNRYVGAARMALKLMVIHDTSFTILGSGETAMRLIDDMQISCDWYPAEIRDKVAEMGNAVSAVTSLGVHPEVGQEMAGLTPEQIEKSRQLKEQDAAQQAVQAQATIAQVLAEALRDDGEDQQTEGAPAPESNGTATAQSAVPTAA